MAPTASEEEQRAIGAKLRRRFLKNLPALKRLQDAVREEAKRGYIIGLDGRKLWVRSQHSALNTKLQSAGALVVKQATVFLYQDLSAQGLVWGKDWALMAHVHDEMQKAVREGLEHEVGQRAVQSIRSAGDYFGFRCPLDGEYKIGRTWADTH